MNHYLTCLCLLFATDFDTVGEVLKFTKSHLKVFPILMFVTPHIKSSNSLTIDLLIFLLVPRYVFLFLDNKLSNNFFPLDEVCK